MKLNDIIQGLDIINVKGELNIDINNVQYDSRKVTKGTLFICIKGFVSDGHKYIKDAIEKGADEIDYVINVAEVKNNNYEYIKEEMEQIVAVCRKAGVISKVIFENCYLTDEEKTKVAEIAKEVKPDFIKTSTGFGTGGAAVEDVRLMKSVVGDTVKVKAAGGIRDLKTALDMIEAGAERLGTSAGVEIIKEMQE